MSDNIKVAIRLRNLIPREIQSNATEYWAAKSSSVIEQINSSSSQFYFDRVFAGHESNEIVYSEFCSPIVKSVIDGFNGTIFAYGQTSSGKTFTLMGDGLEHGIIHHTIADLFDLIQDMPDREFLLRVSFMEIYNETVIDLLTNTNENLKLQDQYGTIKVNNLTEHIVQEPQQVLEVIRKGQRQRRTSETVMNNRSSRSHAIFRMIIESGLRGVENAVVNVSQFNIIDLAGSEKAGQNKGMKFKEGVNINKSLLNLSKVISQLSSGKEDQFISYRDSKLTRILQNSLGGNALTAIICTVTPASLEETASTIKFALRAKTIKNKPQVNEIQTEQALLKKYANEIKELTQQLEATKEEKDQEAKICKKLQQQIENLKRKFVSCIAPEKSRSARRETWGGCLDTARMKMMFKPPMDLLLPHELPNIDNSEQSKPFTPKKMKKRNTLSDRDLFILNEESEADIEASENEDVCNWTQQFNRRSNSQSKYSIASNFSEFLRTVDIAIQTEGLNESPTKAILKSEKIELLEKVLELKRELDELSTFTQLEKQMFAEQAALQIAVKNTELFSENSQISKNRNTCSSYSSASFHDTDDDSLGLINSLIYSSGHINAMNIKEEMFFDQLHIMIDKFHTLLNIQVTEPVITNPYLKVIFLLLNLNFQSLFVMWGGSSDVFIPEQVQEVLETLSKIFNNFNRQTGPNQSHTELTRRFVASVDLILKELEQSVGQKHLFQAETSFASANDIENTDCFDIPDVINVSCTKTPRLQSKVAEELVNAESQTSMLEEAPAREFSPSDCQLQQNVDLLKEDIKCHLNTISNLEHDCSVKEKQILLSKSKIDIQEQIIQSLKSELELKNKTICNMNTVDMDKSRNVRDNFTQTFYLNAQCSSFNGQKFEEEIPKFIIQDYSNLCPNEEVNKESDLGCIEKRSEEFVQVGDIKSTPNQFKNVESCKMNETVIEGNSVSSEILKEIRNLNIYAFDVMQTNMKSEYLCDININSIENNENASLTIDSEIKTLKDMLHRIGFYLRDRSEASEHFNSVLEDKLEELSSLQKKCSNMEDALKIKTEQFICIAEKINILQKNVSKINSIVNIQHSVFSVLDYEKTLDFDTFVHDLDRLETAIQRLVKYTEDLEVSIKPFKEKQFALQTQSTQTSESSENLISRETLKEFEYAAKEKYDSLNEVNSVLKQRIEDLNSKIENLNQENAAYRKEIEEITAAQESNDKVWEHKMKESIKNLEEKYDQEMKNQENDLFEKVENMVQELEKRHQRLQNEKEEYYNKKLEEIEEHYEKQLSESKEKCKTIERDLENKLKEKIDHHFETRLKLEEEIKLCKAREADLKRSYAFIRNKFKEYTQDVKRMKSNKEKLLVEKETQTQLDKNEVKTNGACNGCSLLKKQFAEFKNKVKTETLKQSGSQENLKHESDIKNTNTTSARYCNDNMIKEITYLRKELAAKSALLQTCNCRLIAKPREMIEDYKKEVEKARIAVPGDNNDVNINSKNGATCTDLQSVLQLDIVKKAIEEARQEERVFLCSSGQGPASDIKCFVLQKKLKQKEKEIRELKALNAQISPLVAFNNQHPITDKAALKSKHSSKQKDSGKVNFPEIEEENFTPCAKSGHPYLNPEIARKGRPKKVLIEKNIDPFLVNAEFGACQVAKTDHPKGENKEKGIEDKLNLISEPLKSECKQQ